MFQYNGNFVSVSGQPLNILGFQDIEFSLGGIEATHKVFVVENIMQLCLVGTDFLRKHWVSIDLERCHVKADGVLVPIQCGKTCKHLPQVCKVSFADTIEIEGYHEALVRGKLSCDKFPDTVISQEGIIEADLASDLVPDIAFARVLVNSVDNVVPVRLVNLSPTPVTLYKGMKLGTFHPLLPEEAAVIDDSCNNSLLGEETEVTQQVAKSNTNRPLGSDLFDLKSVPIEADSFRERPRR